MHVLFIDESYRLSEWVSVIFTHIESHIAAKQANKESKFGLPWVLLDPWAAIMNQGRHWPCGFIFWKKKCLEIII